MLDMYWISDEDKTWQSPQEEFYLGSLSLEDWRVLSGLWAILNQKEVQLSYFHDTRLMRDDVQTALEEVERFAVSGLPEDHAAQESFERAIEKIRQVLQTAASERKGVVAFCD